MTNIKFYLLVFFLFVAVVLSFILKEPREKTINLFTLDSFSSVQNSLQSEQSVLVVELSGPIFYSDRTYPGDEIRKLIQTIDKATQDETIKGLILRVDSPGGVVGPSMEIYQAVKQFRESGKPVVSFIVNLCASGAYYAILPSNSIIANRGSIVGSIGVLISTVDLSQLYKKIGINIHNITSGKYKDLLSSSRKMKPEEEVQLQKIVDEMHEVFVSDVILWRKKKSNSNQIRQAANGLIYTPTQALKLGLIDQKGSFELAKEEMKKQLQQTEIQLVYPEKNSIFEAIYQSLKIGMMNWSKDFFRGLFQMNQYSVQS